MPAIEVPGTLYDRLRTKAAAAGFASVDEYVNEMLRGELDVPESFDHLFTPERVAELDRIAGEMERGGRTYTEEEVDAHLDEVRCHWRRGS